MRRSVRAILAMAGVVVGLTACNETASPDVEYRKVGLLQVGTAEAATAMTNPSQDRSVSWSNVIHDSDRTPGQVLVLSDSLITAGRPFQVIVYTIGPNGCWRADEQEVTITGNVVELKPHDVHSGSVVCTEVLAELPHKSTVTLPTSGEWTIRVLGRRARQGDDEWETPVHAERVIHAG